MSGRRLSRRALLGAGLGAGMAGAAALLAACSSDQGGRAAGGDEGEQGYDDGTGATRFWPADGRGDPVELTGESMDAEQIDIADWRPCPVVLNVWYAACAPCREEAQDLNALSEELGEDRVRFLGINSRDTPETALSFQRTHDVPYPSLHDSEAAAVAALQGTVPLSATPATVVLDQQGRVAARIIGMVEKSTLQAMIEDVLAEAA